MIDHTEETHHAYTSGGAGASGDVFAGLRPTVAQESRPVATNGDTSPDRAVEMSRMLTGIVQDLVEQLESQETQRRELEERIVALESHANGLAGARDQLRGTIDASLSADDLQNMHRALQALAQDPNHIMVLASVAQQAKGLLAVVSSYARIQEMLA